MSSTRWPYRSFAIVALILACILPRQSDAEIASDEILTRAFEAVVFGPPSRARDRLIRPVDPIRFELYGSVTDERFALLQQQAADLADVSGLQVHAVIGTEPRGPIQGAEGPERIFQVYVVGEEYFVGLMLRPWVPSEIVFPIAGQALCFFVTLGQDQVDGALIGINSRLPESTIRHCLIEETAQPFGAFDDTTLLNPSAFNDFGGLIDRMTENDRIILRTLFHPSLEPGMPREEVMALVETLLPAIAAEARANQP
ncbi:MAG: DUF2927 domain-containing protein [Pseudomonadota bacterium]